MKEVVLLRHAKSSWPEDNTPDEMRPLARRGKKDAARVGDEMPRLGLLPDLVLCSPALRARDTLKRLQRHWPAVPVQIERSLYDGGPNEYIEAMARLPASAQRVLLVAHNPTLEEVLLLFTGHAEHLKTASFAVVRFSADSWEEIARQPRGELRFIYHVSSASKASVSAGHDTATGLL